MECNQPYCKHYNYFSENNCSKGKDGKNIIECFEIQPLPESREEKKWDLGYPGEK